MFSSSSFQEFAHLKIPLQDIAFATNNFADENLVGGGGFGKVYKGQRIILRSGHDEAMNIVARRLDSRYGQGSTEFWTEISMLSRLKHQNLVSFVGFCVEGDEMIIVNKYEVNESLDKHLNDPTLTWSQRLHICIDAARVLSYIHYDTEHNYRIIHRNIKSSKILLDENWDARLSGFGHSIATRMHRFVLSPPCGTLGYIDPLYLDTGSVTQKSDVFSFGVVLFEVLCGRNARSHDEDGRVQYDLVPLARKHYEDKKLDEMIDPDLRKQMDPQSFIVFSHTAYHCLNRQRTQRPNMEGVVKALEKASQLQWKHDLSKTRVEGTLSNQLLKEGNLEHLKIQLNDIVLATDNFAETYRIGSGGYGAVYKAELDHFDSKRLLGIEWKNEDC